VRPKCSFAPSLGSLGLASGGSGFGSTLPLSWPKTPVAAKATMGKASIMTRARLCMRLTQLYQSRRLSSSPIQQTGFKADPLLESSLALIDREELNYSGPQRRRKRLCLKDNPTSILSANAAPKLLLVSQEFCPSSFSMRSSSVGLWIEPSKIVGRCGRILSDRYPNASKSNLGIVAKSRGNCKLIMASTFLLAR